MDTLEGLHMYNTVKNHLESHKESRKGHGNDKFFSFQNHIARISIFLFLIICLWHVCCTCATMHTVCIYMQGVLNFAQFESTMYWKIGERLSHENTYGFFHSEQQFLNHRNLKFDLSRNVVK